ncbi:hypothetical protein F4818DRAFT_436780 [Hypoxylon cercidicola]|nr:hypothetical protein F4818DRAFT_436780 [Hypoxylon cercidicola]
MPIGIAVLILFGVFEKKWAAEPIIPCGIFSPTTVAIFVWGFAHGFILYTLLVYQPLFFQAVFRQTPSQAAMSIRPFCCPLVAFSFLAPIISRMIPGKCNLLIQINWLLVLVVGTLWCMVDRNTSWAIIYAIQTVLGACLGFIFTGTQFRVRTGAYRISDSARTMGMLAIFQLLGALLSLTLSSGIFGSRFGNGFAYLESLGPIPVQIKPLVSVNQAVGFIPALRTVEVSDWMMGKLIRVYEEAFLLVWIAMELFAIIGMVSSRCVGNVPDIEDNRRRSE